MHENSRTIQVGNEWWNVPSFSLSGTPVPLVPRFRFEQPSYPTVDDAVAAARRRSALTTPAVAEDPVNDWQQRALYGFVGDKSLLPDVLRGMNPSQVGGTDIAERFPDLYATFLQIIGQYLVPR